MKLSKETKLGLIYLKRKILSRSYDVSISHVSERSVVNVEDIEDIFDEMLNESTTPVTPRFDYQMRQDIEDLFRSLTPEEVSLMNVGRYKVEWCTIRLMENRMQSLNMINTFLFGSSMDILTVSELRLHIADM